MRPAAGMQTKARRRRDMSRCRWVKARHSPPRASVIGRVARRIWAIALRERYGAGERAQKLKYHIQTSGRSLHAAEMGFNDIRTTLQALCAFYDKAIAKLK